LLVSHWRSLAESVIPGERNEADSANVESAANK
jgi:hypothetical protein